MKKLFTHELFIGLIGILGMLLAGSEAEPDFWPINVLMGAALLCLAGILGLISRPAPWR